MLISKVGLITESFFSALPNRLWLKANAVGRGSLQVEKSFGWKAVSQKLAFPAT